MSDFSVFTGNAHPELAANICRELGITLGGAQVFEFSNENIYVKINENVRGCDVFIIQPLTSPVNTSIMELLIILDACKRASARRITAVIPYYAYGRMDKKDHPRVPITARLIADCLSVAGAGRMLTMDLHAGQIQGFFNVPVDELTAENLLTDYIHQLHIPSLTVVATDAGFAKKACIMAELLGTPVATIERRRRSHDGQYEATGLIGCVTGRNVLIVDDEVDTADSLTQAARVVREDGAHDVYACATHGVLTGPAIERLRASGLRELILTDTVPLQVEKRLPFITTLSVAPLFAGAIQSIHEERSVSELFRRSRD